MKRNLLAFLTALSIMLSAVSGLAVSEEDKITLYADTVTELEKEQSSGKNQDEGVKVLEDGDEIPENTPTPDPNMNTDVKIFEGDILSPDEEGGVLEISNEADFRAIRDKINAGEFEDITYKLTADLDLTDENWTPIGWADDNEMRPFVGTFDGQGHKIKYSITNKDNAGADEEQGLALFGYNVGTIKNLAVEAELNCKGMFIGGIVGYNAGGTIEMCYVTGGVETYPALCIGGITGMNDCGTITQCYNIARVGDHANFGPTATCSFYVGGITGFTIDGTIEYCYSGSRALDIESPIGHKVAGYGYVGGIAGYAEGDDVNRDNCFVYCHTAVQGIIAKATDPYATILSQEEMADRSVFEAAGWDFDNTWEMWDYYERNIRPAFKAFPEPKKWTRLEGGGTEENPYIIANLDDLENMRNYIEHVYEDDKYYLLTNDIDMSEKYGEGKREDGDRLSWIAIGAGYRFEDTGTETVFKGVFNGNGHTVNNFFIRYYGCVYEGLFGNNKGTIKNLNINGTYIGDLCVGAVAGYNYAGGVIENCSSNVSITSVYGYRSAGGIVGLNEGVVRNCSNTADIIYPSSTNGIVGGIAGSSSGEITNCRNSGGIGGSNDSTHMSKYVGGICGKLTDNGTITNCLNTAVVKSYYGYAGGIAGHAVGTIIDCQNTVSVTQGGAINGGIAGYLKGSLIRCSNVGEEVSSGNTHGGLVGILDGEDGTECVLENCYTTAFVRTTYSEEEYRYGSGGLVGHAKNGLLKNCYSSGDFDVSKDAHPAIGINEGATCENCYTYRSTTEEGVTGCYWNNIFGTGELAYILQQNQSDPSVQVWGQNVNMGDTRDATPVLTNDIDKKVYKTEFMQNSASGEYESQGIYYTNNARGNAYGLAYKVPLTYGYTWAFGAESGAQPFYYGEKYDRDIVIYMVSGMPFTGSGTEQDPYIISDTKTLETLSIYVNAGGLKKKHFKLTSDVVLRGTEAFKPIGRAVDNAWFNGTFDGDGHTVEMQDLFSEGKNYTALFGRVDTNSVIKNLNVKGKIRANNYDAGIAGLNKGRIENCSVDVNILDGGEYTGGIAGYNNGEIVNCTSAGSIEGGLGAQIGGITAYNTGLIENCHNKANVTATYYKNIGAGGIAGYSEGTVINSSNGADVDPSKSSILEFYTGGKVLGTKNVGGVVGHNKGTLKNSWSYGLVYPSLTLKNGTQPKVEYYENAGGVVGLNEKTVENSYNDGHVCGLNNTGGVAGAVSGAEAIIKNSYNNGALSGFNGTDTNTFKSVIGKTADESTVENCYYYSGTDGATEGTGRTGINQDRIRSGELAWLLQNGQDAPAWVQDLSEGGNKYPILSNNAEKRVYKTETMVSDGNEGYELSGTFYSNSRRRNIIPSAPNKYYWSADLTNFYEYDFDKADENDLTLYAVPESNRPEPTSTPEPSSEPAPTVEPSSAPAPTSSPEPAPTVEPIEEQIHVDAVGKYKDEIVVTREISEDKAVFTIEIKDNTVLRSTPVLTMFLAEYDDNGVLLKLRLGKTEQDGNKLVITSDLPAADDYKFMLWDDEQIPLISAISDIY